MNLFLLFLTILFAPANSPELTIEWRDTNTISVQWYTGDLTAGCLFIDGTPIATPCAYSKQLLVGNLQAYIAPGMAVVVRDSLGAVIIHGVIPLAPFPLPLTIHSEGVQWRINWIGHPGEEWCVFGVHPDSVEHILAPCAESGSILADVAAGDHVELRYRGFAMARVLIPALAPIHVVALPMIARD